MVEPRPRSGNQQTARRAIEILVAKQFTEPTKRERDALLIAFASCGKAIHGAAFDLVRLTGHVDLSDPSAICANMDMIELFEVKSTNRASLDEDFGGYFFNLTTAELLVAQALGTKFRFAFVNTLTGSHLELTLQEVFARARGIYPTWSIKF